jgi:hypothetical protein
MKLLRTWATLLLPAVVCASPTGTRIEVPPRLAIRGSGYSVRTDKRPVVSVGLRLEVR